MTVATFVNAEGQTRKLGRRRPQRTYRTADLFIAIHDGELHQTLRFAPYYDAAKDVQPPPASVDWFTKASPAIQRMYLNDTYGDCVIAGKMHQLGVWSANGSLGGIVQATDSEVYSQYQSICGRGDNGCVITDVLDHMKTSGMVAGGKTYKIDGYVSVDWTNKNEVMVALDVFGSLTIGINLPSAWTGGGNGSVWDVTNTGIVGGHDVCCVGYNEQGVQIATWGGLRTITWAAFTSRKYIEECYAQLAPLWYGNDKLAPNGIDAATLAQDLASLGGGIVPPIGPPTPPTPPAPTQQLVAKIPAQIAPVTVHIPLFGSFSGTATIAATDAPVVPASKEAMKVLWSNLVPDLERLVTDGGPAIEKAQAIIADIQAGNWSSSVADAIGILGVLKPIIADVENLVTDFTTPPASDARVATVFSRIQASGAKPAGGAVGRLLLLTHVRSRVGEALAARGDLGAGQVAAGIALVTGSMMDRASHKLDTYTNQNPYSEFVGRMDAIPLSGLWAAIVAFLESPAGQSLLKAIIEAVLAILMGAAAEEFPPPDLNDASPGAYESTHGAVMGEGPAINSVLVRRVIADLVRLVEGYGEELLDGK